MSVIYLLNPPKEKGGREEQDEFDIRNNVLDGEYNYYSEHTKVAMAFPWMFMKSQGLGVCL